MDYQQIYNKLANGNLADSFPMIRDKSRIIGNWTIADEVESLWTTYQQMMLFMLNGIKDSQSKAMRESICKKLYTLTTKIERQERLNIHKEEKYVSNCSSLRNIPSMESLVTNLEQLSAEIDAVKNDELLRDSIKAYNLDKLEKDIESARTKLFYWVWTSEPWSNNDVTQANRIIFSEQISNNDKALIVAAVTLSLLEYPDPSKMLFLLDTYLFDNALVAQRALVGFIIAFELDFSNTYRHNTELYNRLDLYKEDSEFASDYYSAIAQLMFSSTTEKVSDKMRLDIMPTIMQSQFKKMNKETKTALNIDELTKNGENPEWIDEEKVTSKIQEMAELQKDGADLYYSTFSMMKGYSFFSEMAHWFYVFSIDNPCVDSVKKLLSSKFGNVVRLMLDGSPFCNSDKYSLCFMFNTLGSFGETTLENQVNSQLQDVESIDDVIEEAKKLSTQKQNVRRHFIFDLYRFFYSYPYKTQFRNPFDVWKKNPINPLSNEWLAKTIGNDPEKNAAYAEFLMRKEFYAGANDIFAKLAINEFDKELVSIWQKLGFCQQKLGNNSSALHSYKVANNLKPNSKWTLSHLATLSSIAKDHEEALKYYKELLDIDPNNIKYIMSTANLMMELKEYEPAMNLFHKANFIDENNETVKLNIALCSVICKDNNKAMKYILEILSKNADNTNAKDLYAIVMMIDGNVREAYNYVKDNYNATNISHFEELLNKLEERDVVDSNTHRLFIDALALNVE